MADNTNLIGTNQEVLTETSRTPLIQENPQRVWVLWGCHQDAQVFEEREKARAWLKKNEYVFKAYEEGGERWGYEDENPDAGETDVSLHLLEVRR